MKAIGMSLLDELSWRGLIYHDTPGLAERLGEGPITGYVGFDPTARSLQVGNLVPIMLLAHLQRAGGRPIVVVGGGTGRIGDPSGKRAERPLLDDATIEENVARQQRQLARFLEFGAGPSDAVMVNNAAWLDSLHLVSFLRDIGKHFTVAYMLQKESVKSRMESGISYTEFSYMLLQAYDFYQLYRHHACELQMGGSDQWGNITAGIELIRRLDGGDAHGLSAPLITTASGNKFGKSEEETIWLDPEQTSPYAFYQFWINTDDRDVESYLKMFTFEGREAIAELMERHASQPGTRGPQRALAARVTARVHGEAAARSATDAARVLFGELDPLEATAETWLTLASEIPSKPLVPGMGPDTPIVDLITMSGVVRSKSEARRQIRQGGITVNGRRWDDQHSKAPAPLAGGYYFVSRGKKTHSILTPAI